MVEAAAILAPLLFLMGHLHSPLQEDGLFWWVPRALLMVEQGPLWVAAGDLPDACLPTLPLPHQWSAGLPDYAHPPTWFLYLAGWLALLGPQAWVVRLACLPAVLLISLASLGLCRRLAGEEPSAWAALPALLAPALLAQLLRPDTDLPLLAAQLWALLAMIDGRPWRFALLACLAVWLKEPGVLLVAPALVLGLGDKRFFAASLAPLAALAAWILVHHQVTGWGLPGAERLPETPLVYLRDLAAVASIVFIEQGRWACWAGLACAGLCQLRQRQASTQHPSERASRRRALLSCAVFAASQLLVFSGLNFLGGRAAEHGYTHVRYLLPAMTVASLVAASLALRWTCLCASGRRRALLLPALCLLMALPQLHRARALQPRGPEGNLYGLDLVRAWAMARPPLEAAALEGRVWVGSYLYAALTRPYAGLADRPVPGLLPFGPATLPEQLSPGDLLVYASYGEPLGRLGELRREVLQRWQTGHAWVVLARIRAGRAAPAPSQAAPADRPHPQRQEN